MNFLRLLKLMKTLIYLWNLHGPRLLPLLDLMIEAEEKMGRHKGNEKFKYVSNKYLKTIDVQASEDGLKQTIGDIISNIKSLLKK